MERLGLAVLFVVFLPGLAPAQRVWMTPIMGVYVPLKVQGSWPDGACCSSADWETKLAPGPTLGIKLAVEWNALIGIEAAFAYAATARERDITNSGGLVLLTPRSDRATTTLAALRMTVSRPVFERGAVTLGAGFTFNYLSGSGYEDFNGFGAYDPLEDQSRLGLSLAGAFRFDMGASGNVELGFASSFYSVEQDFGSEVGIIAFPQHDMIISLGFAWALRR